MMKKFIVILLFICCYSVLAQQNSPHQIELIEVEGDASEVPFSVIERVPVYKGCDENLSNLELRKCMSESISSHILKKFDINVAKRLGLPDGIVRITTIFKVNKDGEVTQIKIRAPHPDLERESFKAINSIPKFTAPGYQKGKPVTVPYSLPIIFNIDNSKYLSKKRTQKFKKQKRAS